MLSRTLPHENQILISWSWRCTTVGSLRGSPRRSTRSTKTASCKRDPQDEHAETHPSHDILRRYTPNRLNSFLFDFSDRTGTHPIRKVTSWSLAAQTISILSETSHAQPCDADRKQASNTSGLQSQGLSDTCAAVCPPLFCAVLFAVLSERVGYQTPAGVYPWICKQTANQDFHDLDTND